MMKSTFFIIAGILAAVMVTDAKPFQGIRRSRNFNVESLYDYRRPMINDYKRPMVNDQERFMNNKRSVDDKFLNW